MDSKKVLLVDDEPDILMILSKGLAAKGYKVITSENGQDGLIQAQTQQPDIIILDVMMPEMGGGEVAGKLRESPHTKDIPVIFLTALISKEEEVAHSQHIGNNPTLAKPFDIDELAQMIERVVPNSVAP